MAIFDTFLRRKRREAGQLYDPLQYEQVPDKLRVQFVHVLDDSLGDYSASRYGSSSPANGHWLELHRIVCKELGRFYLSSSNLDNPKVDTLNFLVKCTPEEWIEVASIAFPLLEHFSLKLQPYQYADYGIKQHARDAIDEINARMREQGFGYAYEGGQLIRVDSHFVHAEAVVPALTLLHEEKFEGAEIEFRSAHKNLMARDNREAISDALKSLESTIKTICDAERWSYTKQDGASKLIEKLFDNGFIAPELQSEFSSLRSLLASGLPTVRNSTPAGHGQGAQAVVIPDALATFAVNMAASNIRFLVSNFKARHQR